MFWALQLYNTHAVAQGKCFTVQYNTVPKGDSENCGLGLDDLLLLGREGIPPRPWQSPSLDPQSSPPGFSRPSPILPLLPFYCGNAPLVEIEQSQLSKASFLLPIVTDCANIFVVAHLGSETSVFSEVDEVFSHLKICWLLWSVYGVELMVISLLLLSSVLA